MKHIIVKKSLALRTETVRALDPRSLAEVIGGRPKDNIPSIKTECLC